MLNYRRVLPEGRRVLEKDCSGPTRGAGRAQFFNIKASSIACNWNIFLSPDTLSRNFASWSRGKERSQMDASRAYSWGCANPNQGKCMECQKFQILNQTKQWWPAFNCKNKRKSQQNANAIRMHKLDHFLGITSSTKWYPKGHILCSCSCCLHPLAETLWGHTCSNGSKGLLVEGTSFPSQTVTNTALNLFQYNTFATTIESAEIHCQCSWILQLSVRALHCP